MKTLILSAVAMGALTLQSNATVLLDFNGGSAVVGGVMVNYIVTVIDGSLTGNATTGIFDAIEAADGTPLQYNITFDQAVDFTVLPTPGPGNLGNTGDNDGINFLGSAAAVFTSAITQTGVTLTGVGTNSVDFDRVNGGATSGSAVDFGSFTAVGTTSITVQGLGGGTNREAFVFEISESTAVPEPSSSALLGLGVLAFMARRKR